MRYNEPFGAADPNASYVNGNPATATPGSIPPAAQMEMPQREIVTCIVNSGQTPTNAETDQLWKAMLKARGLAYAVDQGEADELIANPTPVFTAYFAGLALTVKVAESNTGAATVNVSGLGDRPIIRKGAAVLQANDLLADSLALIVYDGSSFQLMNYSGAGPGGGTVAGAANVGAGEGLIYAGFSGDDEILFRTLLNDGGISIDTDGNEIKLALADMGAALTIE